MNHDNILDNPKYHVFACLDQCNMTIQVGVALRDDSSKFAQRRRHVTIEQCRWDSYQQIVSEMAKECEKELENA